MCTTGLSHYQERYLQLNMLGTSGSSDVTKAAELMKGFAVSDMCVHVCVCVCVCSQIHAFCVVLFLFSSLANKIVNSRLMS